MVTFWPKKQKPTSAYWFRACILCLGLLGASVVCFYQPVCAQEPVRIDSLPADGLLIRSGWRWHAGDNLAWASPTFEDQGWDTTRANRNIARQPVINSAPHGWLRLTFILDSALTTSNLAFRVSQIGASEVYLDGTLLRRLGKVGATYAQQQAYSPTAGEIYFLPPLSAGRHVLAVRLSQHRPPWYTAQYLYFTQSVFGLTLARASDLTQQLTRQIYTQTLGNYVLVGIFLMLAVIHLLYYRSRRQPVNLVFGLTLLFGLGSILLIELVGLITDSALDEWLLMGQGLLVLLFMLFWLVTYYVYLEQPVSWQLWTVAILLLIPRVLASFTEPTLAMTIVLMIAIIALFTDGIRISINGIRAGRMNSRFILNSIVLLVVILVGGASLSWWLASQYPAYSDYGVALTNMLFFLTLPFSFASILAREYTQTNRRLEDQLIAVAQLSRENESILTKQNETLEQQVKERTAKLTQSLIDLRTTQQQLIQREKMASLGQLTAGIAHEIQNPLNFVNNFSEVSTELVTELQEEKEKGDLRDSVAEDELLQDLTQNLQKINHHGKRASAIVRSMLEHSRTDTGTRQATDLNGLAQEYLRLAFHGLKWPQGSSPVNLANQSDKPEHDHHTIALKTDFDPTLMPVEVVPQELGRVLLNLYTNAFYAVLQQQKTASTDYQPTVTVSTVAHNGFVQIRVGDNGIGIPEGSKDKIFQPFFTTKPTGEGTGLGLSLAYDIITKGHGGTLLVNSQEGKGAEFIIQLPLANEVSSAGNAHSGS